MSTTPVRTPGPRPARRRRPLGGGQIAMIVIGSVVALVGLSLVAGGIAVAAAGHSRGDDGFLTSGPASVATRSYAVSVPGLGVDVNGPDKAYARSLLGDVRIRATAEDPAQAVFIGIAPTAEVARYLDGVGHDDISDIDVDPVEVQYEAHDGGPPGSAPGDQTFWDRSDSGTGTRTLDWTLATGNWTVVVMNADGSAGVDADLDLGGTVPGLRWATVALFVAGGVLLLGGLLLVALPLATRRRQV
ncbi:MAG TPA: hypothetical protein VGP36_16675 [Mycobacteriales bacterium]|nr:hypothetical protein [Mycobacteriales bacterium]